MFEVGEKIFYPMHGAGIIEAVEMKEIDGKSIRYYRMDLPLKGMHIMVPVEKAEYFRIRKIVEPDLLEEARSVFQQTDEETDISTNQRTQLYIEKLKKGNILEEAQVICDLMRLRKKRKLLKKNLSMADKSLLENACKVFISELALVKEVSHEQASFLFNNIVNTMK